MSVHRTFKFFRYNWHKIKCENVCGVPSAPACTNSICPELLNKLESWIKWNPISRFLPKCKLIIEIQTSELNELDVCLQSTATQTACRARERLITVTAAGTHRPYFIWAAACLSVQWASTPKDECVQVGLAFKSTVLFPSIKGVSSTQALLINVLV